MAKLSAIRQKRWEDGPRICRIGNHPILRFEDFVLDHIIPGKMGGCRDDSEENLQDACVLHNFMKGSKRNFTL